MGAGLLVSFILAGFLIFTGIRSFIRIARRAREARRLEPGPADTFGNATSVYAFAFSKAGRSRDTVLLVVGFVGGLVAAVGGPELFSRLLR